MVAFCPGWLKITQCVAGIKLRAKFVFQNVMVGTLFLDINISFGDYFNILKAPYCANSLYPCLER